MAADPLVSVLVPVYDARRFLAESVGSVLEQDYRPLEVIVVDDGSTDGSADEAARLAAGRPEVRTLRRRSNGGPAAARNDALAAASGALVTFLDADDRMADARLSFAVEYLTSRPEVGVVIGRQHVVVEEGAPLPGWLLLPPDRQPRHSPMTMVARRELFDRVGPFDAALRVGSDADWLFRAASAGVRIQLADRLFVHRRIHGANLTYRQAELRAAVLGSLRARVAERRSPR